MGEENRVYVVHQAAGFIEGDEDLREQTPLVKRQRAPFAVGQPLVGDDITADFETRGLRFDVLEPLRLADMQTVRRAIKAGALNDITPLRQRVTRRFENRRRADIERVQRHQFPPGARQGLEDGE